MPEPLKGNNRQKTQIAATSCAVAGMTLRRIDSNSTGWDDRLGLALEQTGNGLQALADGGRASDYLRQAGNSLLTLADELESK